MVMLWLNVWWRIEWMSTLEVWMAYWASDGDGMVPVAWWIGKWSIYK